MTNGAAGRSGIRGTSATVSAAIVNRRAFVGGCMAMPFTSGIASAINGGFRVSEYQGRYAVDSHRIVDGFFASPLRLATADVTVIVGASGAPDATTKALARSWAANGQIVIVPDLAKTYGATAMASRASALAALKADLGRLRRMTRASGRVNVAIV